MNRFLDKTKKLLVRETLALLDVVCGLEKISLDLGENLQTYSNKELNKSWNIFTNPKIHNKNNFCYLVHGLQNSISRIKQFLFIYEKGGWNDAHYFNLLENPLEINKKKLISASVVNTSHIKTYGELGLIIKSPFENILHTCISDNGTDFTNPEGVLKNSQKIILPIGNLIKQSCENNSYNEVVLTGETKNGKVEVVGFWINTFEDGEPIDRDGADKLSFFAKNYDLPLIKFVRNIDDLQDKLFKILDNIKNKNYYSLAINESEKKLLMDCTAGNFRIIDENLKETKLDLETAKEIELRTLNLLENLANSWEKALL
ncbi:MAG: hypothetical protein CO137_01315 [Candidatus Magasanikbacteria bacterium CG_4_9_14_3_um_filter_32_9]|uniref:Uncharacterized protein n=1 Tax=Candidatus Magasanikbacteria bacterium CG_4_9_14_3_um_filter_32_9 TaxID=1974644 RepID=A0A2M7Z7F1_9BACT|nr:MAG: hypothetical protein CO137_01315 [Candidatus Magasanikbacteria bacterium CG_4_9_14_3_um_filter_32_9]